MELESSKIKFSRVDKEKGLRLPTKITEDIAYLSGVLIGDGHLRYREDKGDYFIKCVGHPTDEKSFYDDVLTPMFRKVFGIRVNSKLHDGGTTYGIQIHSKALLKFFSDIIGIPTGKKSRIIVIPYIFKKSDKLTRAFIRGYADTDFCLTLKRRYRDIQYYPVIVGASNSKKIMEEIATFLENNGFRVSRDFDRTIHDERFNNPTTVHRIQLYGHSQLIHWMNFIGFRSPKHLGKLKLWRERNINHSWPNVRIIAGGGFEFGSSLS